jgi:hypothetical protein
MQISSCESSFLSNCLHFHNVKSYVYLWFITRVLDLGCWSEIPSVHISFRNSRNLWCSEMTSIGLMLFWNALHCVTAQKTTVDTFTTVNNPTIQTIMGEPGSSVSIVSGYGLDDRAEEQGFFLQPLVSRPALGPTQPSVQWVPGVISPGLKRGRGVTLTTQYNLVPKSRMSRSYTSSPPPPKLLRGV